MTIREWYNNHKDRIEDLNFSYNICELKDFTKYNLLHKVKFGNFNMLNDNRSYLGDCNFVRVKFDIFDGQYINIHFIILPEEEAKRKLAKQTYVSLEKWVLFNKPFILPKTKIYVNVRENIYGRYVNKYDVPILLNIDDYNAFASCEILRMSVIHGSEGEGIYLYLLAK